MQAAFSLSFVPPLSSSFHLLSSLLPLYASTAVLSAAALLSSSIQNVPTIVLRLFSLLDTKEGALGRRGQER